MIGYVFFRVFIMLFGLVPFWLMYLISDALSFVLFRLFNYRKKVVVANLKRAFPEKSDKEIEKIRRVFNVRFTDLLLESFKGFTLSRKELLRRYKVVNPEFQNAYFNQGKNILALGGHYTNWEWAIVTGIQVLHQYKIIYYYRERIYSFCISVPKLNVMKSICYSP